MITTSSTVIVSIFIAAANPIVLLSATTGDNSKVLLEDDFDGYFSKYSWDIVKSNSISHESKLHLLKNLRSTANPNDIVRILNYYSTHNDHIDISTYLFESLLRLNYRSNVSYSYSLMKAFNYDSIYRNDIFNLVSREVASGDCLAVFHCAEIADWRDSFFYAVKSEARLINLPYLFFVIDKDNVTDIFDCFCSIIRRYMTSFL